jgi:C-terminal processing protease CtpA/Prc
LIIDLRNCEGGSPDMVMLLLSCFMPAEPVLVSTVYFRPTSSTRQYWTLPYLPIPRYTNKPVYILTSKRVFSAAEGFCEHMQRLRHAIVVGEPTRGGAHMSRWENVDPNFAVSVPIARHLEHDWEGIGIQPDVAVSEPDALKTALAMASK